MRAIVLERNKMVNRRLVRFLACAGMEPVSVDSPEALEEHLEAIDLLAADAFDGDVVAKAVQRFPRLRAFLWTAEPLERSLRYAVENKQISNVFGRANFESAPRDWELSMMLRRIARPKDDAPPFASYLNWGFTGFQESVSGSRARDENVEKVQQYILAIGVPKRVAGMFGELAHEMLMNALFDAPVDAQGNHKYNLDRKAELELPKEERPTLRLATDGKLLAIQVIDPFGRIERRHVFDGLARGLKGGTMDQSHGGAGLGMVVCHNSTVAMVYDVVRNRQTSVTGLFDLDMNLREFRTQGKSLHYFER